MKPGKISESILKRSVLKEIKSRNSNVIAGPGVSEDCGAVRLPEGGILTVTTDPVTCAFCHIPQLAVYNVINDLTVSGSTPLGILITLLLPESFMESALKEMMRQFEVICADSGITIMGGHTETSTAVTRPIASLTGIGIAKSEAYRKDRRINSGQEIVMTKSIGIEGTAIIAKDREEELIVRFTPSFVRQCQNFIQDISVQKECEIALHYGASAMHDVSEGGIFGALWEIAEQAGMGLQVDLKEILVRQETIEVCELFRINPYQLLSGGCALLVTDDGAGLVEKLLEEGISSAVIGTMMNGNDRVIINGDEKRFLDRPTADELQKLL